MKRTTALIAFSSAMALATAASAQLGGGLVGGAAGQVGGGLTGGVTGAPGGLTGQIGSTTRGGAQGAVNAAPRAVERANPKSAVAGQTTTGASTDAAAQVGDRRVNSQGAANASTTGQLNADPRSAVNATGAITGQAGATTSVDKADTDDGASNGRVNRQGPANASATGVANANANAGLASTTAPDLTTLRAGQTVRNAAGTTLGTISKIERTADGTIKNVLVAGADGQKKVMRLAPSSLSLSGDVVTTTEAAAKADKK